MGRWCLEPDDLFRGRPWPDAADVVPQLRDPAAVTGGADSSKSRTPVRSGKAASRAVMIPLYGRAWSAPAAADRSAPPVGRGPGRRFGSCCRSSPSRTRPPRLIAAHHLHPFRQLEAGLRSPNLRFQRLYIHRPHHPLPRRLSQGNPNSYDRLPRIRLPLDPGLRLGESVLSAATGMRQRSPRSSRRMAFRCQRAIYRWKARTPYNDARYVRALW